jgi:hypothetical protein
LELLISLLSETTNDIRRYGNIWTMLNEVITNFSKVLNWILTIHLFQNVIVAGLDWDVNEAEDSWMV